MQKLLPQLCQGGARAVGWDLDENLVQETRRQTARWQIAAHIQARVQPQSKRIWDYLGLVFDSWQL